MNLIRIFVGNALSPRGDSFSLLRNADGLRRCGDACDQSGCHNGFC
ncbi:hypothetical protein BMF35_a2004 [Aurantiacibacter gangjinensis]|nr:hypothetical protein BMF35_a2004 [Aurantiacibacter gangjinensis]